MANWTFRASVPTGVSFTGQMPYKMAGYEIVDDIKKSIQSISIRRANRYIVKHTGFEYIKYKAANVAVDGDSNLVSIEIMFIGNMERWAHDMLRRLAIGVNGSGMPIEFFDDIASSYTYKGYWVNAGDFVESSEILCGASMVLECYDASAH